MNLSAATIHTTWNMTEVLSTRLISQLLNANTHTDLPHVPHARITPPHSLYVFLSLSLFLAKIWSNIFIFEVDEHNSVAGMLTRKDLL